MSLRLLDGSEAMTEAAIAAGLRFYSGYPMSPSTNLLEAMASKLPQSGGVCINADTEIEGIMMASGAAATGARAATGSTGGGCALMQEAIAEAAISETPLVVFTIGRAQQDYRQATKGGGWGDYNTIVLAPKDVSEAVEHVQTLFHLADKYRCVCILLADNIIARTQVSVDVSPLDVGPPPDKSSWALDGSTSGTGKAKFHWSWGVGKVNTRNPGGVNGHWNRVADKFRHIAQTETRWEEAHCEDAELVVVAFGTAGKFVEYVVSEMREAGTKVGYFRPVTLWPFPGEALARAAAGARRVAVFELNAGQMIEDVTRFVDRGKVSAIGGISSDEDGLNIGRMMAAGEVRRRIADALKEVQQ